MTKEKVFYEDDECEIPADSEDFGKCIFCGCMSLKGQEVCSECDYEQNRQYVESLREDTKTNYMF